jgi:hypothetical protein
MERVALQKHLQRFGRRLLAIGMASGVGWGLAAALLLVLAGAWFDLLWELPPQLRIACCISSLIVGALLLAAAGWLALRSRVPQALAYRLDTVAGTGGQIRSGVDLLLEPESHVPLTSGLATLAVGRAGQLAGKIAGASAVPAKPLGWSFGGFGALILGVGIASLCLPRLAWTQWLRFTDPYGDHPPFSRALYKVEPGNVQVVYGGGLDIRVTTEGAPVDRLHLVLETEDPPTQETLPLFQEPGGEWTATLANLTSPGRYFVRSNAGRSPKFRIDILTVPQLEAVRFRITPPAYTNRAAYQGPLPQGGLAGLPGTGVQLWAKSNRPLSGGTLEVPGPEGPVSLALTPLEPDSPEATGSFEIRKPGKLQMKVIDVAGQPSAEPYTAPIALLTDERPLIRLIEPPALSFATPSVSLPVVLSAEDDYGIARIELYRSLNDSRALPMEVPVKQPPPTRWSEMVLLPLAAYRLEPGDEIKLYARVEDNDPAGPKGSESAVAVVRIISQADFERLVQARQNLEMLQSKYRQAQRRMEAMAEEVDKLQKKLDKLPPGSEAAKQAREELQKLARKLREEADALRQLTKQRLRYDLDQYLSQHLERMTRKLDESAAEAEGLAREPKLSPEAVAKALEKMRDRLNSERKQLEKEALDPLEHLAAVYPLLEDASRFVILYQRQKALADRLESLKGKDRVDDGKVKNRMRDFQAEQQEIRTALGKLLDDIEDHVAKLPDQEELKELRKSALEFVEAVRGSSASEAMAEAEAGLAEVSGTRSSTAARQAADILAKFVKRLEGEGGLAMACRGCLRFQPVLDEGLGDTLEQLLADAGLMLGEGIGNGRGMGLGGGDGYSSRRSTLDNVGLYGGLPTLAGGERSGSGSGNRAGRPRETGEGGSERANTPAAADATQPGAAGAADATVPAPYRRRVADYFQRIADETGKR